ncbi:MAG: phage major capsid protein [Clostridia bacterium]|nr:phage major capsid protein [Clostridia bacterium]
MLNLTTADKALKDYYLDAISEQLNTGVNPIFAQIEKTSENVYGKTIKKIVTAELNGGISAGTESGDLPSAKNTDYKEFVLELKNLYGTIEISDKAIRASGDNQGAVVNLLNAEMEALVKASKENLSRMMFGDGTGSLGVCFLNVYEGKNHITMNGVLRLKPGFYYDIYDTKGDIVFSELKVVSVYNNGAYVESDVDFSTLSSNTYYISLHGSKGNEITGLKALFSESETLYGLNRSENAWLNPYKMTMSGPLSKDEFDLVIDEVESRGGEQIDFFVCSRKIRTIVKKMLIENDAQLEPVVLENGYKTFAYNGIPFILDDNCSNDLFLINTKHLKLYQLCDWEWLESEDGKILHQVPGKAAYSATLVKYCELLCDKPSTMGIIENIG